MDAPVEGTEQHGQCSAWRSEQTRPLMPKGDTIIIIIIIIIVFNFLQTHQFIQLIVLQAL